MPNYIFNNTVLTQDDIEEIASIKGYTLEELFEKNPDIKETDPDEEGKETPSQEIESAAVEESVALEPTVTDSTSEDTLSELSKIETPQVKAETSADTTYIPPTVTSEESQKIINDFNKASNVNVEFENKKATAEKLNRFKKDQFNTAEKEEYNLYKQTGKIQPTLLEQSDIDQKIANNRRDFMEDIAHDKRVQLLNQEVQLRDFLVNNIDKLKLQINDNANAINSIFLQYEESIKQGVPYSVDEYNIAKQKSQELIKSTKQMESDLLRDLAILNKKNEFIDSFKRSYSNIDQLENVLKTTATDMVLGLAVPLDMLKSEEGKEKSYTKDLLNYRQKLQKESAEGLPKAIPVESISSFKDFVNWGADAVVNFVPSGVMAFTGPAAPYLFGASGFGSRIAQFELEALEAKNQIPKLQELYNKSDDLLEQAEIKKQIDKYNEALNVSNLKKLAVSGIYGASEVATEMLTTVRLVKDLKSANTLYYKEGFAPAFKQAIKDIPTGGVLEGGGEGLNNIIGNVADITILGEDKNAWDGVTESTAQGFFIGNGFRAANAGSLAKAYAYDVITDKQNKQEIENILKEINNLSNAFTENTNINTKEEAARVIRSKIKELSLNQDFSASQFLKLSGADQKAVFEADRQSKKVNERWKKIANSNLDETSKDLIRKDLEAEFNGYQDKKISLLRKSNVNTELQQPKGLQEGDFYRGYKIHQVNDAAVKRNNSLNKLANKVVNVLSNEAETMGDFINSDQTLLTLNDGSVITKEEAQQINKIWESGSDGGFDPNSKNQYTIVERAAVNNPSTALHEYFHAMAAAKGFTEEQFNKIKDDYIVLLNTKKESGELTQEQYNKIFNRLPLYDGTTAQAEELINLTADAVNLQIIKETDFNFLQRFANNVKSIVGSIIGKDEADNFNINTAEDAWNMVQTFSKDVLSSASQKQIIGTQPEEEDTATEEIETIIKQSRSKEASDKVQELYEQKGVNAAVEIIEQFKPITNKIVEQRKNAPGFDKQLLTDEIETGAGGILDLIQAYDPASNVPLAAYINKFLPVRAITASRRILEEEFAGDIAEAPQVAAEAAPEVKAEVAPAKAKKQVKKETLSAENQQALEDVVADLELTEDKLTFKTLPNAAIEVFAKQIGIPAKKFAGSSNFTQAELGKVITFIEENIDIIRQALPQAAVLEGAPISEGLIGTATGVPNNLLKDPNLYTRKERTTKKAGLVPYEKNKGIDNSSILKAIGIIEGKRTAGPRDKQAQTAKGLINVLAKFATNQEVRQQKDLTPQQKTDIETGKGSRLLYSLNTKGNGKWVQNPLNNKSKIYSFKVGQVDYEITTFQQSFEDNGYDFELFDGNELEEKFIKDIADDNNSLSLVFADVDTGATQTTGVAKDGLTNQFKVFGIVANSTIDLIKKEKLNSIIFSGRGENRKRLYEAMVQKFKKELGWESYNYQLEDGDSEAYIVYDPKVFINPETAVTAEKESRILFSLSKPDQDLLLDFGIEAYPMETNTDVNRYINDIRKLASIFNTNDYKLLNSSVLQFPDKIIKDTKVAEYLRAQLAQLKKDKKLAARVTEGRTKPTQAIGNTVEKFIKSITSGKLAAYNERHSRVFNKMWKDINQAIKENPDLAVPLTYFLSNSINEPTNPHRMGAPIIGYEPGSKKLYYEHAMQSTNAYRALMRAILTDRDKKTSPTFDKEFKRVKKNYFIIAISPENNTKLDKAGYKNAFDDSWTNWWQRYFNSKVAAINGGIDPNNIIFIKENGTGKISFGEELGINSEGKEVKGQQALSKSISKAAAKNNKKLPKSLQLEGALTNAEVLTRMQELDNEANEARIKYSKSQNLDEAFNDIIEAKTGIETYKRFSPAKAAVRGASKGKFNFFIPPSAEDFVGLLYKTLAKGKVGDRQMQWYKDNLLDPYARAMNDISAARVAMFEDYKQLKKDLEVIPKDLKKKSVDEYTREQAVRVYIWNEQGNKIPGLFKTDQKQLVDYVTKDSELKLFADQLITMQKNDDYSSPKEGWLTGSITTDLLESVNSIKRKKYLEQWQNNVDEIFSEVNMNKLEAAFGKPYRKALENILTRMKTGRNKPFRSDTLAGRVTDWLNNSVGAIMFFNTRSAVLQTISSINFVNWSDNNIYQAGKAFANQPQYWKDFKFLFNSDFLKERRGGLRFNVSESEIADMAKKGGARGVISKILQAGFLPTQAADSFAIASGGATFYRNRIKSYIKEGLTEAEAQEKAFQDFREIAEESQQSSRPDRISAQQAGALGRTILAFANTPAQYARLTKKAASDLINGRGDAKTNISKLLYYGAVQNLIFNTLQQAAFAIAFGDDDEDEKKKEEKYISVANGMADGLLRGIGVGGAVIATLKNALIKIIKESEKKRPDYAETAVIQLLGISPPIQSKAQKIRSALKSYEWNKKEMLKKGFSLDNPAYLAGANVISASTNIPLDRVIKKVDNVRSATRDDISKLERMMLLAGWSDWQLGIQPERKPKKKKKTRSSGRGTSRSNNRSSNRR